VAANPSVPTGQLPFEGSPFWAEKAMGTRLQLKGMRGQYMNMILEVDGKSPGEASDLRHLPFRKFRLRFTNDAVTYCFSIVCS
jgi:hypothetical protein